MHLSLSSELKARTDRAFMADRFFLAFKKTFSFRLLSRIKTEQDRLVKKIFENMRKTRSENTEESIRQHKLALCKKQAFKRKCL